MHRQLASALEAPLRVASVVALLGGLALAGAPAHAQGGDAGRPSVTFALGLGAGLSPEYPGASSYRLGPTGSFGVQHLVLPGGLGFGSPGARPLDPGFGPTGSFRYLGVRDPADAPELAGTGRIGRTLELGGGLAHVTESSRVFGEVRRGFGGHRGWVADVGVDAILRPAQGLVLTAGPRAQWGHRRFVDTYFGVPAGAALPAFSASGGLVSVGAELGAFHDFGTGWGVQGTLAWNRLRGDAGRSPITRSGSRDQYEARLVITRQFSLRR